MRAWFSGVFEARHRMADLHLHLVRKTKIVTIVWLVPDWKSSLSRSLKNKFLDTLGKLAQHVHIFISNSKFNLQNEQLPTDWTSSV